jgi:hypothetical protein
VVSQGDRISNLSEDFGEICVLPSRPGGSHLKQFDKSI